MKLFKDTKFLKKFLLLLVAISFNFVPNYSIANDRECLSDKAFIEIDSDCNAPLFLGEKRKPKKVKPLFHKRHTHTYKEKVYSYTDVSISKDGSWTIKTLFSNGRRLERARMSVTIAVLSEKNECLFGATQEVNLRESRFGKTREHADYDTGKLPIKLIPLAKKTKFFASQVTEQSKQIFNQWKPHGIDALPVGVGHPCRPFANVSD